MMQSIHHRGMTSGKCTLAFRQMADTLLDYAVKERPCRIHSYSGSKQRAKASMKSFCKFLDDRGMTYKAGYKYVRLGIGGWVKFEMPKGTT